MRFDKEWVIDQQGCDETPGRRLLGRVLPCRHGNCPSAGQRGATHGADAQLGGVADAVPDNVPGATGLRYELISDQVDPTGRVSQAYRRLSDTVQRAKSLEEAGQISIDYQPQYQQLELNSLDVWRAGKRIDIRTQAHYAKLRRESGLENGLIGGALTLSITLPDLRVGDRVDYGVTISGSNPVFGKGSYDVFDAR